MSDAPKAAAGWFADADDPSKERYWDGERWTDARRPAQAPSHTVAAASPVREQSQHVPNDFWALGAAVLAVVVGSIGPWVTNPLISRGGLDGDGWITLVLAGLTGATLVAAYSKAPIRTGWGPIVAGVLIAAVGIIDAVDIEEKGNTQLLGESVDVANIGWGLYMVIAGGVALVVIGLRLRK
jgi:hypothetical protein